MGLNRWNEFEPDQFRLYNKFKRLQTERPDPTQVYLDIQKKKPWLIRKAPRGQLDLSIFYALLEKYNRR